MFFFWHPGEFSYLVSLFFEVKANHLFFKKRGSVVGMRGPRYLQVLLSPLGRSIIWHRSVEGHCSVVLGGGHLHDSLGQQRVLGGDGGGGDG